MKIITIVGARPQFIKSALVSKEINTKKNVIEIVIHTGQHYDKNMSEIFFDELKLKLPEYQLNLGGISHGAMTGRQLEKIEQILLIEKPDCVLVYGDTNSTLAAALAASKLNIPIAHIEAGLRSYNKSMPEEQNRVIVDHLSKNLYAPCIQAKENLLKEGLNNSIIEVVGDVMYDMSIYFEKFAKEPAWFKISKLEEFNFTICTIHRAENVYDRIKLDKIMIGLKLSKSKIILLMHPNLRNTIVSKKIQIPSNVLTVDPVSYFEMLWLLKRCKNIATDSGGLQKEAYFNQKHCIVLREETEWVELIATGANTIVGVDSEKISNLINLNLSKKINLNIYGNGDASKKIVESLIEKY